MNTEVLNEETGELVKVPRLAEEILIEGWRTKSEKEKHYETQQAKDNAAISSMRRAGFTHEMIFCVFRDHSILTEGVSDWAKSRYRKAQSAIRRQCDQIDNLPEDSVRLMWQKYADEFLVRAVLAPYKGREADLLRMVAYSHHEAARRAARPTYHLSSREGATIAQCSPLSWLKYSKMLEEMGIVKVEKHAHGVAAHTYALGIEELREFSSDSYLLNSYNTLSSLGEIEWLSLGEQIRQVLKTVETGAFEYKALGRAAGIVDLIISLVGETSRADLAELSGKSQQSVYRATKKLESAGRVAKFTRKRRISADQPCPVNGRGRRAFMYIIDKAFDIYAWAQELGFHQYPEARKAKFAAERKAFHAKMDYYYDRMNICTWFKKSLKRRIS